MEAIAMGQAPVTKSLIRVSNDNVAEAIYFNRPEKQVVCFSTQLNCRVGCKFCASPSKHKKAVNLTAQDMVTQINHVLVENFDKIDSDNVPEWVTDAFTNGTLVLNDRDDLYVTTLEGKHTPTNDQAMLIRGVEGELHFCDADIFAKTYDPA